MNKETTTVRIPTGDLIDMQKEAEEFGLSLNSYLLVTSKLGRKMLNCKVSVSLDALECTSLE